MFERRHRGSRSRVSVLLASEQLESRTRLSVSHRTSQPPTTAVTQSVTIDTSSTFVTQQSSALNVTVNLVTDSTRTYARPPSPNTNPGVAPTTSVPTSHTEPLAVTLADSLSQYIGPQPNPAPPTMTSFEPFRTSVTFPAGVTSESVSIPIPPGTAASGPVLLELSVTSPALGVSENPAATVVVVVDNAAALPPTITSAQLIGVKGHHAAGIAITFSKPMSPASVANVQNYSISTTAEITKLAPSTLDSSGENVAPISLLTLVPLRAATYDSATDTVTLIPRHSLTTTARYSVLSAHSRSGQVLTDLAGTPLLVGASYDGDFSIDVSGNSSKA